MIVECLLAGILGAVVGNNILLATYLRRKKPGPKPKKSRQKGPDPEFIMEEVPIVNAPRKRHKARTYEEMPLK